MSKHNNRICKACNESYKFCPNCSGMTAADKYRIMFCSKNCRDVFQTCVAYDMKHIVADEAKEIFSSLDLSKLDHFSDAIKADIDEIMGNNKKHFKKKIVEEPVVEEQVIEPVVEPTIPVEF